MRPMFAVYRDTMLVKVILLEWILLFLGAIIELFVETCNSYIVYILLLYTHFY